MKPGTPLESFRKNHIQKFSDQTQMVREDLSDCINIAAELNKSSENTLKSLKDHLQILIELAEQEKVKTKILEEKFAHDLEEMQEEISKTVYDKEQATQWNAYKEEIEGMENKLKRAYEEELEEVKNTKIAVQTFLETEIPQLRDLLNKEDSLYKKEEAELTGKLEEELRNVETARKELRDEIQHQRSELSQDLLAFNSRIKEQTLLMKSEVNQIYSVIDEDLVALGDMAKLLR
ncbi:unnamed protein product [Blepharisma stoltei]|uniref:Uncharacterized protein n=1 Tax=Blepharisma stoltei TaxID=1481888 RepID=A0AAU9I8G4_9CILI|nr:unnamed protein product [Blepharisma stoltei]